CAFSLLSAWALSWSSQNPGSRLIASISWERRRLVSTSKTPPERLQSLVEVLDPFLDLVHLRFPFPFGTTGGLLSFEPASVDLFFVLAGRPVDRPLPEVAHEGLAQQGLRGAAPPLGLDLERLGQRGRNPKRQHPSLRDLDVELLQRGGETGDPILPLLEKGADPRGQVVAAQPGPVHVDGLCVVIHWKSFRHPSPPSIPSSPRRDASISAMRRAYCSETSWS